MASGALSVKREREKKRLKPVVPWGGATVLSSAACQGTGLEADEAKPANLDTVTLSICIKLSFLSEQLISLILHCPLKM